jgi:tRNA threonylcarbamoyladenosine biosynthesis protein TsaB
MWTLGLDFSSSQRSVALVQSLGRGAPPHTIAGSEHEVVETGSPGSNALGMIEAALRQAGIEREQIERISVGLGPGSYSGIRTTIALAQGWQLARSVRISGVSSAACLAAQASDQGLTGNVAILINAQRNEFYLARYEIAAGTFREIQPLKIVSLAAATECRDTGDIIIGPEVAKWFPHGTILHPRASTVARLAIQQNDSGPGDSLEPIYLRETQFVKAPPPKCGFK